MDNCIFCKIIKGGAELVKIWEDEDFIAILDINPNTKGVTLVIPKEHYDSYAFDMPEDVYSKLMIATRKVAKILEKGLRVQRIAMVMEGMGINHVHIKMYPINGIDEKFKEMWGEEKIFFDKYEGYISTQIGPQVNFDELRKIAEEIKNNS
ncbi:MAG: HIT domain-containing protein [Candidatus Paceibacterota bacterium]|jgi:diadenosine tetraphosphate (Ap4A) HIT family hydrolase